MSKKPESFRGNLLSKPSHSTDSNAIKAPVQPAAQRDQPPLSPKENQVLRLLLDKKTEASIANELGRSPNTIHIHIRNIYYKLGVNRRKMLFQFVAANPDILKPA